MMKTISSCYQQNITEPVPLSTLPPPSSSSSSSSSLFPPPPPSSPKGPGQDSADDSTVGVHVSHARCSRTTRCHCAQVHPGPTGCPSSRDGVRRSSPSASLAPQRRGWVVSWPFFRVGGAWPVVFFRVGGA